LRWNLVAAKVVVAAMQSFLLEFVPATETFFAAAVTKTEERQRPPIAKHLHLPQAIPGPSFAATEVTASAARKMFPVVHLEDFLRSPWTVPNDPSFPTVDALARKNNTRPCGLPKKSTFSSPFKRFSKEPFLFDL
jgi:hypothetical protein